MDFLSQIIQISLTNFFELVSFAHITMDFLLSIFVHLVAIIVLFYLGMVIYLNFVHKHKKNVPISFNKNNAPFVTIQIPTRNEIVALRCAKHCLEFDYPKEKYEILIGDDSNKREVSLELDSFAKSNKVKIIRRSSNVGFKPGNLNNMLKYSMGEIIVIFDSDFVPEKDFLRKIITPFVFDSKVSAVQAKWGYNNFGQNFVSVFSSATGLVFHNGLLRFMNIFGTGCLCGSAEAVRKSTLIKLGKWREGSLTEDIEFSLKMQINGDKLVFLSDLECKGESPYKVRDLMKQQMRWAYGIINAYMLHSKEIINSKLSLFRKFLAFSNAIGYVMPLLTLLILLTALISFLDINQNTIDLTQPTTGLNLGALLGMAFLATHLIVLYKEKKLKFVAPMIVAFITIGFFVSIFVNIGVIKAIFGKKMEWFLMTKPTK